MRLAEVSREVADHLNEASERYQVPQRLRYAGETARETARVASESARRGAQHAYHMALEHPRASAAAGIILAAAIVGGVLWYIFGSEREEQQQRRSRRVRAGTGRKRAKSARAATA